LIPAQQVPPQKGQKNSSLVANLYTCTTVGLSLNVPLRLSQLNVYQLDLALDAPRQKLPARWLQPFVATDRQRLFPVGDDHRQGHRPAREAGVHFWCATIPRERVYQTHHADCPSPGRLAQFELLFI